MRLVGSRENMDTGGHAVTCFHTHTPCVHITDTPPTHTRPQPAHGTSRREETLTHGESLTPAVASGAGRLAGPPEKRLYQALLPELML